MITVGVVGCGHWGPNHIRIFSNLSSSRVKICADMSEDRLKAVALLYPHVQRTKHYQDIFKDPEIDAVCISTPTDTHFQLTQEALEAGKHVLCEKPLALRPEECLQLQSLADKKNKILMVGHIFLFNQGIARLKEYIESGQLGRIHYAHSSRTNLGPFRYDVNALWDLAPHDISIFNHLFDSAPVNVSARGVCCLGTSLEDLAFVSLQYSHQILVNLHVSWLDPKKIRQITIVGDQKMASWDDLDNEGPIKLYDKHVEKSTRFYENYGEFQLLSREGSITIPHMPFHEPLKLQGQYFVDCILQSRHPDKCDGHKAYDVVRTLQAAQESMRRNGAPIEIK